MIRTRQMLVPPGDSHGRSSRTDVYPVIFQRAERQVMRSLKTSDPEPANVVPMVAQA